MKKIGVLLAVMLVIGLVWAVPFTMAGETKKVEKPVAPALWNKFVKLFSNSLFFCRGECTDFRVGITSEKGNLKETILARYDLSKDWVTYNWYSSRRTTKNPFQKKLPFCITFEVYEKKEDADYIRTEEAFYDLNFDGKVDEFRKYEGKDTPSIPVKELPPDMQKQLQARYDGFLEKLVGQMQKELREYLGIQRDKK